MKLKDRIYKIELDNDTEYPTYIHIDLRHITAIGDIIVDSRWGPFFEIHLILNDNSIKIHFNRNNTSLSNSKTREDLFNAWVNYTE